MTDYDVIVAGCGPAGLMACGELAKKGINALGVDKKPRLDINNRSASGFCFLDQPFMNEIIRKEDLGNKTRYHYTDCGFTLDYSAPMEGIHHTHYFSDTGKHWQVSTTKKPFYNIFDPSIWMADRYKWAVENGAEFLPGTLIVKAKQTSKQVELTVRTNGQNRILTCKKLIASDGLSSRVARTVGANKNRTRYGTGAHLEYEMTNIDCDYDRGDMFFFGAKNFGGRAGALIMIPSPNGKNAYRVLTMSVLPASNGSDILEYFINEGPYSHWFKNAKIIDISGALVELQTPMYTPFLGNILFVGDSAAWAECLFQCATMAGYKAAEYTDMELKGKNGFEEYTKWWGEHFEWIKNPKKMADYGKRIFMPRFFTVEELDFLFDLAEKNPLVMEEAVASPFDFTEMAFKYFMAMPEVPDYLKTRMQEVIDADQSQVAKVIGQVQK